MGNDIKPFQISQYMILNQPNWSRLLGVVILVTFSFSVSSNHSEGMNLEFERLSFASEGCSIDNRVFKPGEILTY